MDVQQYRATVSAVDAASLSGTWAAAPALAASGVAMKNTSGQTVFVEITGGTVTVVKIGNVTTGITSGTIRLRPNEKVSITYSVAPTLAWLFEAPVASTPTGAWAGAPALAASGVAMVNTSGFPVTVHVSGGTVGTPFVKIDGVTTGLSAGSFRLRRGQSISITYSVAPTLAWIYA